MTKAERQALELRGMMARIAELETRLEAQGAKQPEPPKPFVPDDWQPPNPLERIGMPLSALREMAQAVPTNMLRGIVRDNQAPQGPSSAGAIPSSQQVTNVRGSGWSREIPLGPPPGIHYVDQQCVVDAGKDKVERIRQEALLKAAEPKS
jgi:hypothetical protein